MTPLRRPAARRDFEIVVISALPLEAGAVAAFFDHHWGDDSPYGKAPGDRNAYSVGAVGHHNVVLAHMPGIGKASAAAVAADCRASFPNIKLAIVVGVCGAVPNSPNGDEILLGDVIISEGIFQYDFGRQLPERFVPKETLLDSLGRPNSEIRALLAKLKSDRKMLQDKMMSYLTAIQGKQDPDLAADYPGRAHDRLFVAAYHHIGTGTCQECGCNGPVVSRKRLEQDDLRPAIHFGLIASGDTVMKSAKDRNAIAKLKDIIGFEMEGAGVWDSFPCMAVIKGVCDYADSHKAKAWQRKTQIALEYSYWLRKTYTEISVFWVHASNTERFRQAYASIAQECQVPGYDDPKIDTLLLVKKWLEREDCGRWLMVIDNADDTEVFFSQQAEPIITGIPSPDGNLGRYLPECTNGAILVTTRNKQTGLRLTQGKGPIEIRKMDEDESGQLLRTILDEVDFAPEELSMLSSRLEYLPLALVQATAFIQENTTTIGDYLQLIDQSDQNLVDLLSEEFETVGRDSGAPRAVAETWILSFEQIQQQNAFAGEILSLMSLFDRQAIPSKFFPHYRQQQGGDPSGKIQLTKALGVLKAFSFVTEDKAHNLDMHRLVQLVTRKWLINKGTMQRFTGQALLAVSQAYPYGNFENRIVCGAYLPHVYAVLGSEDAGLEDERVARASLFYCVAGFFSYQGRWKDAEEFQLKAVKLRKAVLGDEHPDTLNGIANLASTYRNQGRWKEAEMLQVQVMDIRKQQP
ncbi:nucleoside phosphorylase domain-containing protein [Lasiosphaeria ovina]|uniref:Nucleoside phosphorylase domain-containing protein n=1 Tax=Lasiosphaeria ovina TaxID=92902 RepID=A0AAE0JZ51_9PEZI|nr:nucleoside phosphorylase domain-containing protein [Lasiosphaeria ovina]